MPMLHFFQKLFSILLPSEIVHFWLLVFAMLIGAILETASIGLLIPAIGFMSDDNFLNNFPNFLLFLNKIGNPSKDSLIFYGVLFLFSIYIFKAVYLTFLTWWQNVFIYRIRAELSKRLFYSYLNQPWTFHLERNSAQLINTLTSETNQFGVYILQPTLIILSEMFIFVGITLLLTYNEPLNTLILIGIFGLSTFLFYKSVRNKLLKWGQARQFHETSRIQHVQQGLGGAKEVKLGALEDNFLKLYDRHNKEVSKIMQIQTTVQQQPRIWLEILTLISFAIIAYIMDSHNKSSTEIYIALGLFAGAAYRILPSINKLTGAIQNLRYANSVLELLHQEITMIKIPPQAAEKEQLNFSESINIKNLSYSYTNGNPILHNISMEIKHGQCIGLIGSSGSGKSTLIDIILGLLPSNEGSIFIDGEDIVKTNLRFWQKQIGYVPQSIFLTDDTLRHNIAFGIPDELIDEKAITNAIEMAQLQDFINNLPNKLDTVVGERGVRLSGGQRQRIGIARALYHNPNILVFDEATSALDMKTEEEIMGTINSMIGNKTIIIIAHRVATLKNCHKIYQIEDGGISEVLNSYIPHIKIK